MIDSDVLTAVTDDIFQVQIPLPFALRIVNCYLLRGDAGWTVVDTGLNTSKGRAAWQQAFADLAIQPRKIEQIVLTHTHPDHYGLAGWLGEICVADGGQLPSVYMSAREAEVARGVWVDGVMLKEKYRTFWEQCDVPDTLAQEIMDTTWQTRNGTLPHPIRHEIIGNGRAVRLGNRQMESILMPGHSDGQLVFYDATDKLLLCGDHVLQKITPNISLWPHGDPDPLGAYLASLPELAQWDIRLALPGHGPMMEDVYGRMAEITEHHQQRLQETIIALPGPSTVFEVSQRLFEHDNLSVHEMRFAATETLAHLDYLVQDGRVRQSDEFTWRFSLI
ncbi:MAG: MBL fold metallo-hydrolase [Chloroflexi bacterium]|nr:MBL fold metallo-hydrolase [Chloroflexota bacterium]